MFLCGAKVLLLKHELLQNKIPKMVNVSLVPTAHVSPVPTLPSSLTETS